MCVCVCVCVCAREREIERERARERERERAREREHLIEVGVAFAHLAERPPLHLAHLIMSNPDHQML